MRTLSVLVTTHNSDSTIARCLESVTWADELVVVDSLSNDRTVEVCRPYAHQILARPFTGYASQKNWAIPQCAGEWVLQLDSDEYAEPGMQGVVQRTLEATPADVDAYRLPRKNHVLGQWLKTNGLYPDYQTRLFRKTKGRFVERQVHERLQVPGRVGTLHTHILHEGMPYLSKQLRNLDAYTRLEANELKKRGAKFHWTQLFLRPIGVFAQRLVLQRGFSAGYRGLILAAYVAFYSFMTYAKLWELEELHLTESP